MSRSVAKQIATGSTLVLVTTLFVIGAMTAVLLHTRQIKALDAALLVAAHGRAHPDVQQAVEVEHSRSPVDAWIARPNDVRIPRDLLEQAIQTEQPVKTTYHGLRMVLLPFEIEDEHAREVAVAAAPAATIRHSVGPFLAIYGVLAVLAAIFASTLQLRLVREAFEPIERVRREAESVAGFGEEQRLTEDGPTEIEPLIHAVNELLGRLEAAYQAQTRFTAEAAHELRTPVATMLGELDVVLRNPRQTEHYREALVSTREEVMRLRALVDGLTALTQLDAGAVSRNRTLMRAGEVVNHAVANEKALLDAAGNHVTVILDDDPEIMVNRSLIEAAVGNLLRNAARYASGTAVEVRVVTRGAQVDLIVDDAGSGVSESERTELFGRFVRSGSARERDRTGLGLGLSIAREVARRHGGDCVLEASPLGGVRARISLPIA